MGIRYRHLDLVLSERSLIAERKSLAESAMNSFAGHALAYKTHLTPEDILYIEGQLEKAGPGDIVKLPIGVSPKDFEMIRNAPL